MVRMVNPAISPLPIRIADRKVDTATLRISGLVVNDTGHLPGRVMRRTDAAFANWALAYIAAGSGTYRVNGGPEQAISAGSVFFVWAGDAFTYGPVEGGSWEEYYVTFDGSRTDELERGGLLRKGDVLNVGTDGLWALKFASIASLLESGDPANADRAALLLESLLFEIAVMAEPARNDRSADLWRAVSDDIAARLYDEAPDTEALAARFNVSVSTVRRLVKQRTGYPLHDYVHRLKICAAKQLLLNTNDSVKQIALALRYEDVYYFSRLFKKIVGVSPDAFRKGR